MGVSQR
jgi:hypothetical protein